VGNGAFSSYPNGTASYVSWLQGSLTPHDVAVIMSSFGKKVTLYGSSEFGVVDYSVLANTISACSYYQGGWTKVVEFYNHSMPGTCLGIIVNNYTPVESNVIVAALKSTRLGATLTANQLNSSKQIQWSDFYYNNATILGQMVEYRSNSIAASTLFQLESPQGIFLSRIDKVQTNVSRVNSTCPGLVANVSGADVCSTALPTTGVIGNSTYGAVHSRLVSSNYSVDVYSLVSQQNLAAAHANAAELMGRLGINSSSVDWQPLFKNGCTFEGGFNCSFSVLPSGNMSIRVTDRNYSSVTLDNITCSIGGGTPEMKLSPTTIALGDNALLNTFCSAFTVPGFAAEDSFQLRLGFTYHNIPMAVNGTLNVTNG
jgi:hypothetical protein